MSLSPPIMSALKPYVVTFNCGRETVNPSKLAAHLFDSLPKPRIAPDILIFALQEVAPIAYSFLGGSYLSAYLSPFRHGVDIASTSLDASYINIITRNVGMTAIMVFVLRDQSAQIHRIETAGVGVGVHEMGNKGAVAVRMGYSIGNDSLEITTVAAHLAPMEDGLERRNEDWKNIVRGLVFTPLSANVLSKKTTQRLPEEPSDPETEPLIPSTPDSDTVPPMTGIYTPTSHLVLAGDLNYRTSITGPISEEYRSFPQPCEDDSYPQHYDHLFQSDQLTAELRAQRTCHGLSEAPVEFPPTYKYSDRARRDAETDQGDMDREGTHWDWAKHRWPRWCDRILYLQMPSWAKEWQEVEIKGYTALPLLPNSDHRPVACCLEIPASAIPQPGPDSDTTGRRADQVRKHPPFELDPGWKARRAWARKREVVVGLGAYLTLTWEGRGILLALMCGALGGWAVIGGLVAAQ